MAVVEGTTCLRIGAGLVLIGAVGTFGRRSFNAATALLWPEALESGFDPVCGTDCVRILGLAAFTDGMRLCGELSVVVLGGATGLAGVAGVLRGVLVTAADLPVADTVVFDRGRDLPGTAVLVTLVL